MKNYTITVNGNVYDVTVEEGAGSGAPVAAAPVAAPAAPAAAAPAAATADGTKVNAPMPGNILAVNVTPGQAVKEGDVMFVLEAMKMENEIVAPVAGTVKQVLVSKGAVVETDAVLAVI